MRRHFKKSDTVQLRSGGPLMRVLRYIDSGKRDNRKKPKVQVVVCEWFQKTYGWRQKAFRQNKLVKKQYQATSNSMN